MEQMMFDGDGKIEAFKGIKKRDTSAYHSRVFTDRPPYADYDAPHKFMAIQSIIAKRLIEHPKAICSYSGGADSDMCFGETGDGQWRLRPLYYVSDADKAWYKDYYGIRYSDAYEVYGLTRTGCCGCPISYKAVDDLEKIRPFEPNLVKAAWNIFGDSYRYRQQYNDYKARRLLEKRQAKLKNQVTLFDLMRGNDDG